jgi:hypothetical protein
MEEKDRKTIKTIGIIVIAISALIAFGNGMGALAFSIIGGFESQSSNPNENLDFVALFWNNYLKICFSTFLLAIINIIGGIGLTKYRNWGRVLLIIDSTLFILSMILISGGLIALSKNSLGAVGILMPILSMLIFMIPFILLIRFLTRDKIKINFT